MVYWQIWPALTAERRSAKLGFDKKGPPTNHPKDTESFKPWHAIVRRTMVMIVKQVDNPFKGVSQHIEEAENVRFFLANGMGHSTGIIFIPSNPVQILDLSCQ